VLVTPGPSFSVDGTFERHVRLPFTAAPDDLDAAVGTLAGLADALGLAPGAAPAAEPAVV
jgi:hypothetical protein